MKLPPIRTAQGIDRAEEEVTQAIGRGKLTLDEAVKTMQVLASRAALLERVEWEQRLEGVEEKLASAVDTSPLGRRSQSGPSGLRLVGEHK
jgi:ribosome biogenesis SPOUT family RNA methylase Rps3